MTTTAFLSGRLPSGEANGLASIVRTLVDDPGQIHALVVLVDCVKVTQIVEAGSTVPTIRIRRIEAITDAGDRAELARLLGREYERRTGQLTLPLELEQDVRAAFGEGLGAPVEDGKRRRKRPSLPPATTGDDGENEGDQ